MSEDVKPDIHLADKALGGRDNGLDLAAAAKVMEQRIGADVPDTAPHATTATPQYTPADVVRMAQASEAPDLTAVTPEQWQEAAAVDPVQAEALYAVAQTQREHKARIAAEDQRLRELLPEWNDPLTRRAETAKLIEHAQRNGWTLAQIAAFDRVSTADDIARHIKAMRAAEKQFAPDPELARDRGSRVVPKTKTTGAPFTATDRTRTLRGGFPAVSGRGRRGSLDEAAATMETFLDREARR